MKNELLKIFDKTYKEIGVATRQHVHAVGHWHETFHCWIVGKEKEEYYIYFQLRSSLKDMYPNLLDITAAGHILANEHMKDGIREVKEEIGLELNYNNLTKLGVIPYSVKKGNIIDNEFANVFLVVGEYTFDDFALQLEEVVGLVKVPFQQFYDYSFHRIHSINVTGFKIGENGEKLNIDEEVSIDKIVPHVPAYYQEIATKILEHIERKD
ncbi:NUDIX hydrolase [Sutcliffiella sp. NC1]|uniref:NUDIX hydrolase n=1 Tax=Sutcliffiella sp. NC1 TaxID=3004096 RepID=UPI0022DE636F|nr:NUDIX hydrolase [Sutcliffiella sp. NC1]WBL17388.1 NUDIX hydrolase [Sutcliffiella sp. NC1]